MTAAESRKVLIGWPARPEQAAATPRDFDDAPNPPLLPRSAGMGLRKLIFDGTIR